MTDFDTFLTNRGPSRRTQFKSTSGRDVAITSSRIGRVASGGFQPRGGDRHDVREPLHPARSRQSLTTPTCAVHVLAALSGKVMGLIDLETATVTEWATRDGRPGSFDADSNDLLVAACRRLLGGAESIHLFPRFAAAGTDNWADVRVRIGLVTSGPQPLGIFEFTPLSGRPGTRTFDF